MDKTGYELRTELIENIRRFKDNILFKVDDWTQTSPVDILATYVDDIADIKEGLRELCSQDIENDFESAIEYLADADLEAFEEILTNIIEKIENAGCKSPNQYEDGVIVSGDSDPHIKVIWSSISACTSTDTNTSKNKNEDENDGFDSLLDDDLLDDSDDLFYSDNKDNSNDLDSEPIEMLELSSGTVLSLKKEGIYNISEILAYDAKDFIQLSSLNNTEIVEILYALDEIGSRLDDCDAIKYSTIDDYVVEHFTCQECRGHLNQKGSKPKELICKNCVQRHERIQKVNIFTIDILPVENSEYVGGERGFTVYFNITNNTSYPLKLKLKECSIFTGGRQRISNYNLTGYAFDEDYIFPGTVKTFAKIWITDKWIDKDLKENTDYLTVSLLDIKNHKLHYFKFYYIDEQWVLYDFYKL